MNTGDQPIRTVIVDDEELARRGIELRLASHPDITIVLMTGFADQRERAFGLDALVYDVIPKPFTLSALMQKVGDALTGAPVEVVSLARASG